MGRNGAKPSDIVVLLCLTPGAGGAALALAGATPRDATQAFLLDWWGPLVIVGVFIAWRITRDRRP